MTCGACGVVLRVGDWPYCPHGEATPAIQTNESFIGGLTIENMGHTPVTVYSREEFNTQMRLHGVEQRIKYVPGDKHLTNWAAGIDAYTLEAAKVLLSRSRATTVPHEPNMLPSYRGSVRLVKGGK